MNGKIEPLIYDSDNRGSPFWEELTAMRLYFDLLLILIWRDFATRYKRSWLGVAWSMLNPLFMMIVLSVVFSWAFPRMHAYPVYVISGIVPWTFFTQTTTAANRNILWGGDLFKQVYLPKASFVVAIVGSGIINMLLSFVPLLVVALVLGVRPGMSFVTLPFAVLCLAAFTLGVGLIMATFATFYPDVAEFYYVILTGWMYMNPIIWTPKIFPPLLRSLLMNLNPMADLVELFHSIFYYANWPAPVVMFRAFMVSLLVLCLGWSIFSRNGEKFAYRI